MIECAGWEVVKMMDYSYTIGSITLTYLVYSGLIFNVILILLGVLRLLKTIYKGK